MTEDKKMVVTERKKMLAADIMNKMDELSNEKLLNDPDVKECFSDVASDDTSLLEMLAIMREAKSILDNERRRKAK